MQFLFNNSEAIELVGLVFTVSPQKNASLFPEYAQGLHAWFLDQVRQSAPDLSQELHDEQSEKSFTISRLEGNMTTNTKQIYLSSQEIYRWYLTALSQSLVLWMQQWLRNAPSIITLRQVTLNIHKIEIIHPPTTYQKLFSTERKKSITLSFVSPTSFRSKGHHLPLPLPHNLFHSYLRRWNYFSSQKFSQDPFLTWVHENVLILRHQLESVKVAGGKKGAVTGFVGAIELSLDRSAEQQPEFVQLYYALAQLAPYCGTGHKTTFGLGQTRLGWLVEKESIETIVVESLLAKRIEELYDSLMHTQKRKGGTRASQVCQTRAKILARRELGESLSDIADDLAMPYETVKTYVKLARRALNQ